MQGVAQASGFDHRWLLNECTLVLQTQSKASKPDQGYMAGALAGLSSALAQCQVPGVLALVALLTACHILRLHLALLYFMMFLHIHQPAGLFMACYALPVHYQCLTSALPVPYPCHTGSLPLTLLVSSGDPIQDALFF